MVDMMPAPDMSALREEIPEAGSGSPPLVVLKSPEGEAPPLCGSG